MSLGMGIVTTSGFYCDIDLGLAPGWLVGLVEGAQLNRCVENWSRQYEGSEANNEGSARIFPNTAFVPVPPARCWHHIFNHKSLSVQYKYRYKYRYKYVYTDTNTDTNI